MILACDITPGVRPVGRELVDNNKNKNCEIRRNVNPIRLNNCKAYSANKYEL